MKDLKLTILLFIIFTSIERTLLQFLDFGPKSVTQDKITTSNNLKNVAVDFIDHVEQQGYPAEEYELSTEDFYKLRIHRIPGSPFSPKTFGKPVVYIQHGMFGLSDMFIIGGPTKDLAYILADAGYDVWLGNSRGNTYCRSHAVLSPDHDAEFWDFSFHEIAVYDMSATIDYIQLETNQTSLIYVGHSMGTTMILVLLSMKPEYNQKIHLVVNMASIGNWKKPGKFIRFLRDNGETIKKIFFNLGIKELFPHRLLRRFLSNETYCEDGIFQTICINLIRFMNGYNSDIDTKVLADAFASIPAGASSKTAVHYHQNMLAGKFQMFDYGLIRNMANYGTIYPPAYNLRNIITPVVMIYGKGDTIASPEDSLDLLSYLKNSWIESVPNDNFSHLDFLWGKNIKTLLQDRVLQIISNYKRI